jgi:hypothetical protein
MTREEQTDELLEVLEPTPARHPECVHDIVVDARLNAQN